jgi:IS5 family transposase
MKPRPSPEAEPQEESRATKASLRTILCETHPMVKLADEINWQSFDEAFGVLYSDKGRPGISTRILVALHYLKYLHDLSDEDVVYGWLENPYWQYLSGMVYFQHELPCDPSSLSRWRSRIGEQGAEKLLKETIEAGLRLKLIKKPQLKRVNVDTTVQEKHIRFPTDARLYDRMRERLVKEAQKQGIKLRQSYVRVAKKLLLQQSRYAHARQFKRAAKCTKKLKTFLGRVVRDIERNCPEPGALQHFLLLAHRLLKQEKHDKNKLYSIHEPEVECISKGKAHQRYEFGAKVSISASSKGAWVLGAKAFHGNPYDGHTLNTSLEQVARLSPQQVYYVYTDGSYKSHDYQGQAAVYVDRRLSRSKLPAGLRRWLKRRSAIEPTIGHLKHDKRMERNRLKGTAGDQINAILSAAAYNFNKLLKGLVPFCLSHLRLAFISFIPFGPSVPPLAHVA